MNVFLKAKSHKLKAAQEGITMLLTLLITAALMAMSGSIFSFLITELRMSGELSDSFYAMYAADEGMERAFYDDRIRGLYPNPGVYTIPSGALSNGSCYTATITRGAVTTTIKSVGKYQCSGGSRQLQRSFEATYQ